jgi:hypothetical protein
MTKNGTHTRHAQQDGTLDQGQVSPAHRAPGSRGSPACGRRTGPGRRTSPGRPQRHITGVPRPPARAAGGWRFA